MMRCLIRIFAPACFVLWGCGDGQKAGNVLSDEEMVLAEGKQYLSSGEFGKAHSAFSALKNVTNQDCNAAYGLMLADVLAIADRFDSLLELASNLLAAPGFRPQQIGNSLNSILTNFFQPFEKDFAAIQENGRFVIQKRCVFYLPGGLPINLGGEGNFLFAKMIVGYEWDYASARVVVVFIDFLQALADILLGHDLSMERISETLDISVAALDRINTTSEAGTAYTYIDAVRALGVILDANPEFMRFKDMARINNIDNSLAELLTMAYSKQTGFERGWVPDMLHRQKEDPDPSDNVTGWIDNGDGVAGGDDRLVLGIRAINLFSTVQMQSVTDGVELILNSNFGDIEAAVAAFHTIFEVLGNQLLAVDDPSIEWRRLGLQELNTIVKSVNIVSFFLPNFPEALEFDLRAIFTGFDGAGIKNIREIIPYWYDDDDCIPDPLETANDNCRAGVFAIEGEGAVTNAGDFVFDFDASHFPNDFTFGTYLGDEFKSLTDVSIPPDGISPQTYFLTSPLPYLMMQDPNINGAIWVDLSRLSIGPEGEPGFQLANQYDFNKALSSLIQHFIAESRFELGELFSQETEE